MPFQVLKMTYNFTFFSHQPNFTLLLKQICHNIKILFNKWGFKLSRITYVGYVSILKQ